MHRLHALVLMLLALLVVAPAAGAQDRPARQERPARTAPNGEGVLRLLPTDAVSDKEITVGGGTLSYTATAGTLTLYDQNGERSAAIFYTAYVLRSTDVARRPVTFAFNGGPGAASAFLHLGLAGPRVIDFGPDGRDGAAAKLVDNPDTWLAFTDLVMIDPVGTGWSRPAKSDGAAFHGVQRDAESLAKAIALYVAHSSRSASPKYLLGESYGGFRAAKVARALQSDQGIIVSGIMMVSPLIESAFLWGGQQFALGAALQFPSLVASEMERTKTYTPEAMAEAERFAVTDYLTTLVGPPPTGDKALAFYGRIAQMTGLPPEVVEKSRGFVRGAYLRHLKLQGLHASSYDGGFSVPDPFPESEGTRAGDPMLDGFPRALAGTFTGYARDELGFKTDITYILLNGEISGRWDWGGRRSQPGVSEDLRVLLAFDPSFRLMVVHGRSDLVTPYGVNRYLVDQLRAIGAPDRVRFEAYRGGHMFYFSAEDRRAFTADAKDFYERAP